MDKPHIDQLVKDVRKMKRHMAGESVPGIRTTEMPAPDVRTIREAVQLSQSQFAKLIGVNLRALQNWEEPAQGAISAAHCAACEPTNLQLMGDVGLRCANPTYRGAEIFPIERFFDHPRQSNTGSKKSNNYAVINETLRNRITYRHCQPT